MIINAALEATCFDPRRIPDYDTPEVIMAGRSNVGKSSLINALLGRKLAHVGGTPGKTRSVNFYRVDDKDEDGTVSSYRVVDLPGYGYASRSKSERNDWLRLVSAYMRNRAESGSDKKPLACHLVDFRHGLLANDRELQEWLNGYNFPMLVIFTKADKIPRGKWRGMIEQYVRDGLYSIDMPIVTSAEKMNGIDELRNSILKNVL